MVCRSDASACKVFLFGGKREEDDEEEEVKGSTGGARRGAFVLSR